jgi:hypothetical protein
MKSFICLQGENGAPKWISGVPRGVQEYKYKGFSQERTMAMDRVSIYAYTCIGLVGSAIVGLIVFAWIVLRKFWMIPRQ